MSTVSDYDYAKIKATWLNLTDDNFQCRKYEELGLAGRKNADRDIAHTRQLKGCFKMFDEPRVIIENVGYHSCLCHESYQHESIGDYLGLYEHYKKGFLPDVGGSLDQTAYNMELIALIDSLHLEREVEMNKKKQKDMDNQRNRK